MHLQPNRETRNATQENQANGSSSRSSRPPSLLKQLTSKYYHYTASTISNIPSVAITSRMGEKKKKKKKKKKGEGFPSSSSQRTLSSIIDQPKDEEE